MKFLAMLVAMVMAVPCVFALDDITPAKGGSFYDGSTLQPRADSAVDTTVTTAYTPRFVGDLLLGKTGTSNAVWVARGLTTNDWSLVNGNGGPFAAQDIADDAVTEAKLKAVDSASDEDVLTYESTTGDFEWHSVAQIQAKFTEGSYTDSTILSADVKDGELVNADLAAGAAIAHTKLAAVPTGQILVGNATSQAVAVAVSGAVTMGSDGTTTIAPTTTVTRLVATTAKIDNRTPVLSYSAVSTLQMAHEIGATNGQVVAYGITYAGALPAVVVSYSMADGTGVMTNIPYVHSKTYTNCVVVCDEGKTVDLMVFGLK